MVENAGRRFLPGRPNPKPEVDGPAEEFDSSSTSSWGNTYHAEEVTMERPKGLTGEDRVRPKTRSQLLEKYGPQLKICPSAERILVGDDHDTPERQTSYTQEVARPGSAISGYEHDNAQGARQFGFRQDENVSPGSAREVPNYCRPLSPENNTRVNRKPVPKNSIMDQSHSEEGLSTTPQADPFSRMGTLDSYPVRSSSLQAQTGLDFTARSPEASKNLALNEKGSSPASDDIAQEEGHGQNESSAKLPDSKSIRMLDSFRNMFSKSRASERSVTGKEQAGGHNTKRRSKNVASTIESGKSDHQAKAKAKRSKNTRNLRVEDISSPMPLIATLSSVLPSPAPSYSSVPASSRGRQEIRTPSFARPTQSTRTRQAASANARQTSVAQEARTNRIKVLTPSTGSPSRSRIQKRTTPAASSTLKRQESQEGSDVSDRPNLPEKNTPTPGKLTDSGQMGIDSVQGCIDVLRVKIYNATDPRKREKYLHVSINYWNPCFI